MSDNFGPRDLDGVQRFPDDDPVNLRDPVEELDVLLWEADLGR